MVRESLPFSKWKLSAVVLFAICLVATSPVARADDWPQWRGPNRDGVWRETGIIKKFESDQLTPKWRTEIGTGYSGPAVADGKVFVTDRLRKKGIDRILCLDASTGKVLWSHTYPASYGKVGYPSGPRATPTVDAERVYTVGTTGDLHCLDVQDGRVLWKTNYIERFGAEIPIWGFASAPLIDGRQLIALVGGKDDAAVVSFDKMTGEEIWRSQYTKDVGYAPPLIIEAGGKRQLIMWLPEKVVSLNPKTGHVYWEQPFKSHLALTVPSPVFDGRHLLVSTFYNGPMMLRLAKSQPTAEVMWRGNSSSEIKTDKVHCMISTPMIAEDYIYAVDSYGELRCLEIKTGKRIWETYKATGHDRWWNAFLIRHEDRTIIANEQGELIFAHLTPTGYKEICRAQLLKPTNKIRRRMVVWSHPAFANKCVYARNDGEIVCVSLAAP